MKELLTDNYVYAMSAKHQPAMTISDNETIKVHTFDCFENQITQDLQELASIDFGSVNPATGPIYVEGAEPGDVLAVTINKIDINTTGTMAATTLFGVFTEVVTENQTNQIKIDGDYAILADNLKVKLNKMVGVIGTAPKGDEEVVCGTPDYHGGNMDTKEIAEGATVYLPVHHKGGLLSLGDLHAAMGDGETCGTGVEIAGVVTLTVNVKKQSKLPTPAIANADKVYFIHSDEDLNVAAKEATLQGFKFLTSLLNVEPHLAGRLCSASGDLGISQVVNPKKTAKFAFDKSILAQLDANYNQYL